MTFFRIRNFQVGLLLATALSVSMWSSAGQAYTPEQQQACSGDAFRLCGPEIPDVDRVTACMVRNRAQLSPGCKVYFTEPESAPPPMARKPVNLKSTGAKSSATKSFATKSNAGKPSGAKSKKSKTSEE